MEHDRTVSGISASGLEGSVSTDIVLNEETVEIVADETVEIVAEDRVSMRAPAIVATASDFMLDQPMRRTSRRGLRRALVHDQRDGLTVNYNGDYPGGVTIVGDVMIKGFLRVDVPGLLEPLDVVRDAWGPDGPVWKPNPMVAGENGELDRLRQRIDDLEAEVRCLRRGVLPHPLARLRRMIIAMWRAPLGRLAG
jgi:hypothetical protein